ncbi:double-strand break repair helicase AddA [Alphaproteobacteria bacterium]|nr:double-strand break repair helicase AddA [Alphaproteobacteria bacterium]
MVVKKNKTIEQINASKPEENIWVSASAGTGKTTVLVDRMLNLLLIDSPISSILCLTFTKAAAVEMYTRLTSELSKWVKSPDSELIKTLQLYGIKNPNQDNLIKARILFAKILEEPGGLRIQTIHSFCEDLLNRFPLECGISPNFTVLDEVESNDLLIDSRDKSFSNADSQLIDDINLIVETYGELRFNNIFENLINDRSKINKMIIGNGGLEKSLSYIAKYLGIKENSTVRQIIKEGTVDESFDYLNIKKIAEYMLSGTEKEKSIGTKIILWIENKDKRVKNFFEYSSLYLTKDLKKIRKNILTKKIINQIPVSEEILSIEASRISKILQTIDSIDTFNITKSIIRVFFSIQKNYEKTKKISNKLDYNDLIIKSLNLMQSSHLSQWVLYKLDNIIDHVLVDEAQDTSPEQWDLIYAITSEFFSGLSSREINRTLFVVGDEKQSIYKFQGADPKIFNEIKNKFKRKVVTSKKEWSFLTLSRSFRSVPLVLNFIDILFSFKQIKNYNSSEVDWRRHEANRTEEEGIIELWPLDIINFPKRQKWELPIKQKQLVTPEYQLSQKIAFQIKKWLDSKEILKSKGRPIQPRDIMILVRSRSRIFEEVVQALKRNNIEVAGADRFILHNELVVQDLITLGDFVLLPEDNFTLANLLKGPLINWDDNLLYKLAINRGSLSLWKYLKKNKNLKSEFKIAYDALCKFIEISYEATPFSFYSEILNQGGRQKFLTRLGYESNDPIDEFLNKIVRFETENGLSLKGFINETKDNNFEIKRDMERSENKVKVMTVHGAKGLESPIVFLPDTVNIPRDNNKLNWISNNKSDLLLFPTKQFIKNEKINILEEEINYEKIQEYHRLLYVALTRAQDQIYICGCSSSKNISNDSWYHLAENAMKKINKNKEVLEKKFDNMKFQYTCYSDIKYKKNIINRQDEDTNSYKLPLWLRKKSNLSKKISININPSKINKNNKDEKNIFYKEGLIIHRLLEVLPNIIEKDRLALATRILKSQFYIDSNDEVNRLYSLVDKVFTNKKLKIFFGNNSYAEVPIIGKEQNKIISGRIDRLIVNNNEVLILDYKTNKRIYQLTDSYVNQMNLYRDILIKIYPSKKIRCFILWIRELYLEEIINY